MLQGVTKRMKISRRVVANDGTARKEEKVTGIPFIFISSGRTEKDIIQLIMKIAGNAYKLKLPLIKEQDTI